MNDKLKIYTIYNNPSDQPNMWVMRVHEVPGGPRPDCVVVKTLEEARAAVPLGLVRMPRHQDDDPVIYETWI